MEEKNMTALISCFVRAYHTKNCNYKIFNDPLAEKIISKEEYESISNNLENGITFFNSIFKGTNDEALRYIVDNQLSPSVLGRSIFAEKSLNNSKRLGTKQYLVFASGYDTSFYKNKDLKVFEIDKDKMIEDKINRLNKSCIDSSNIEFIKADLTDDKLSNYILKSNYDSNQKSFCSLLGISYYLTNEEFEKLLERISIILKEGSEIVFDYPTYDETINEIINQKLASGANEEMKSKYSFENLEKIGEKCNMLIYEHLNSENMTNSYFYNYNTLNPDNKIVAPKGVAYCLMVKK